MRITWILLTICAVGRFINCKGTEKIATPGVIISSKGRVSFAQDIMTVKMDFSRIQDFTDSLRSARDGLQELIHHKDIKVVKNTTIDLLKVEMDRLKMILPSRSKRSLFSFGGDILHSIFGTATDKQVGEINKKISAIEKWAKLKGTLIHKTVKRVNENSRKILMLNRDIAAISAIVNADALKFNDININQILLSVGSYLGYLIESYDVLLNAVVLASRNIVSPHLLPPSELQDILLVAKNTYRFEPLYDTDKLENYYHVLSVKFVKGIVFVFVPFASALFFNLYHLVPFPSLIKGDVVELNIEEHYLLLNQNYDAVSVAENAKFGEVCVALAAQNYLCQASNFHFVPAFKFDCLINLVLHSRPSPECSFRKVNKSIAFYHSSPYTYIFSKELLKFTISCGGEPSLTSLRGTFSLSEHCGVYSPNYMRIYPSHTTNADAKLIIPRLSTVMLQTLSFPEAAKNVVVQHFQTPKDIQDDGLSLQDFLTDAHPYVTYIGTPLFIVFCCVAMTLVGCFIFKKKVGIAIRKVDQIKVRVDCEEDDQSREVDIGRTTAEGDESH